MGTSSGHSVQSPQLSSYEFFISSPLTLQKSEQVLRWNVDVVIWKSPPSCNVPCVGLYVLARSSRATGLLVRVCQFVGHQGRKRPLHDSFFFAALVDLVLGICVSLTLLTRAILCSPSGQP